MSIDLKSKSFRTITRKNSKTIINHIIQSNISRNKVSNKQNRQELCIFCSSTKNLTKEHVIPRWTYENCTKKYFITNINGLNQTYNKTTIPVCSVCNNERLNAFEVYVNKLFSEINIDTISLNNNQIENIIRWLEIIDYKFQILNARKHFLRSSENGFIPYLADFPLTVLRENLNYSPSKAIAEIRRSAKRMIIKNKCDNLNSLILLKTSNTNFHFFHTMDDFIFIELPQYKLAVFYFYKRTFPTNKNAQDEAKKIVERCY